MKALRFALMTALGMLMTVSAIGVTGYVSLQFSLPILTGIVPVTNLDAPVQVERDEAGIPTLRGQSREDIAYALGFLHGQERFFQMDLLRRNSAGELSALVGKAALEHDKEKRIHRFRALALRTYRSLSDTERHILDRYADGVNQGLASLKAWPWEYLILRQRPRVWQPEDSFLNLYSMYLDLQPSLGDFDRSMQVMKDKLPTDWYDFLQPVNGHWDAPMNGDLVADQLVIPSSPWPAVAAKVDQTLELDGGYINGSNNWAVSKALTSHDSAMLANDMHLTLRVPNIWYRASWYLPGDNRRVTGVTLPGTPIMVVGSNEHLAWGFTNSAGDWSDVIKLQLTRPGHLYATPEGFENLKRYQEVIDIAGEDSVTHEVVWTRWGPVIGLDEQDQPLVLRWSVYDPSGANLKLLQLENLNLVEEALAIAPATGIPQMNLMAADKAGNLGWSLMGAIPNRFPNTGLLPQDWSTGTRGWQGYLPAEQYPRLFNPEQHRLWTANSKTLATENYALLGDGGLAIGARAWLLKDRLFSQNEFTEADFLSMQLDNRATYLDRWHLLIKSVAVDYAGQLDRSRQIQKVLADWDGTANPNSAGYHLTRRFRDQLIRHSVGLIYQQLRDEAEFFNSRPITRKVEYPTWQLITERPEHLVPPGYTTWDDFLVGVLNFTVERIISESGTSLENSSWGNYNQLSMKHPLTRSLPFLDNLLNLPPTPLAGDKFMPNAQLMNHGSSQRLVVSPGHEEDGILNMPGGQASHPLSVYFSAGHEHWVNGDPSPLLPGQSQWRMELVPTGS